MTNCDHLSSNHKTLERKKSKIYGVFTMGLWRHWKLLWVYWTWELIISSTVTYHIKDKTGIKMNYFVLGLNLTFCRRLSCSLVILSGHLFKESMTMSSRVEKELGVWGYLQMKSVLNCGQKDWSFYCLNYQARSKVWLRIETATHDIKMWFKFRNKRTTLNQSYYTLCVLMCNLF